MSASSARRASAKKTAGSGASVLDWLLEEDAPGVALLARSRLLGESSGSRPMRALARRANRYPPVERMLARVDQAIAAGDYAKYTGAYWTLCFLAEMRADGRDPRAKKLARQVLGSQLASGGFAPDGNPGWEIVCLTANCLRGLVGLGFGGEEGVARGYRRLAERILPCGAVPCRVVDEHSVATSCHMTLPQTLRAVAAAPAALTSAMAPLRELLIRRLVAIGGYRYVRSDAREFYEKRLPRRPRGTSFRDFKQHYLATRGARSVELGPKVGWLRFGFPKSYNSDLLEALLALAEAGARPDRRLDEALDHVEEKRGKDGRWRLDESLNGKMLADVERKGGPSKWITLRAWIVLRHFGRLHV